MDALIKNDIDCHQCIQLPLPSDYKGVSAIRHQAIDGEYSGTVTKAILRTENGDLMDYIESFAERSPLEWEGVSYPHMSLVTVARCVEPNRQLQEAIRQRFPTIATVLFTGEDIRMTVDGVMYLPRVYQKAKERILVLLGIDVIPEGFRHVHQKPSVRSCIQWFKSRGTERFPRIMILAGDIAGRGISFTSLDYEWHLTDQFFLPSKGCDEPELIQKIRLCGRYRDGLPLTLYTTHEVWSDLKKADDRLEEVMDRLLDKKDNKGNKKESTKDAIYNMSLYKEKFTSRDMTKNYGTPITKSDLMAKDERNDGQYVVEETDMDRIKRTIQRHLTSKKDTNVAIFLSSLDPSVAYSKDALIELLGKANYQQPESILRSFMKKAEYGGVGGNMFTKKGELYHICEELTLCWRA